MSPVSVPISRVEPVTDVLHGVPVTDPYRWLEDQNSPDTRAWIEEQTHYARTYLDNIPGRGRIRERVRELLDVETHDSFLKAGNRYFFRKRLPGQEQPCIYFREASDGEDRLLVDPATRGTGDYTAVKPLRVSADGSLLLYEVKRGGERTGRFEILDVAGRGALPDSLPHGYLRGFAFAPDGKSFYYVHEATEEKQPGHRAAYHHILGTSFDTDREVFSAGQSPSLRLSLVCDERRLGFLVLDFQEKTSTDFYLKPFSSASVPRPVLLGAAYTFVPRLAGDLILALTNLDAPNRRIVQVRPRPNQQPEFVDIVSTIRFKIQHWLVAKNHLFVSYVRGAQTAVCTFSLLGEPAGELPFPEEETVRLLAASPDSDEVFLETESFAKAPRIFRCTPPDHPVVFASKNPPFDAQACAHKRVQYVSRDGMPIPMFLFGRKDLLEKDCHPTVMTSYGGYGLPMTQQFSVLVAFLVERGVLFAVPNIRGGCEFGSSWHTAAKRQNRQTAYDDFIAAAQWMIENGHTTAQQLGIFGGSNAGLLVATAMTQRPDLFRAVLCMMPMVDMLRYHLFDHAYTWKDEFGTSDDPRDFAAIHQYSPYHHVRSATAYPAVMTVSGDADRNCNPLHARKMTARLQAANTSTRPVILDYHQHRGHSPVLPLSDRIAALTDRLAFLCDQLRVRI